MDPHIQKAGAECGLTLSDLFDYLPNELTIWIDPNEVNIKSLDFHITKGYAQNDQGIGLEKINDVRDNYNKDL